MWSTTTVGSRRYIYMYNVHVFAAIGIFGQYWWHHNYCLVMWCTLQGPRGEMFLGGSLGVESVQQKEEAAFAARVHATRFVPTCTYMYMYTCISTCTCMYTCIYMWCSCCRVHIHVHVYMYILCTCGVGGRDWVCAVGRSVSWPLSWAAVTNSQPLQKWFLRTQLCPRLSQCSQRGWSRCCVVAVWPSEWWPLSPSATGATPPLTSYPSSATPSPTSPTTMKWLPSWSTSRETATWDYWGLLGHTVPHTTSLAGQTLTERASLV